MLTMVMGCDGVMVTVTVGWRKGRHNITVLSRCAFLMFGFMALQLTAVVQWRTRMACTVGICMFCFKIFFAACTYFHSIVVSRGWCGVVWCVT